MVSDQVQSGRWWRIKMHERFTAKVLRPPESIHSCSFTCSVGAGAAVGGEERKPRAVLATRAAGGSAARGGCRRALILVSIPPASTRGGRLFTTPAPDSQGCRGNALTTFVSQGFACLVLCQRYADAIIKDWPACSCSWARLVTSSPGGIPRQSALPGTRMLVR